MSSAWPFRLRLPTATPRSPAPLCPGRHIEPEPPDLSTSLTFYILDAHLQTRSSDPHMREQNDVANRDRVGKQHRQSVDPDAETPCGRHPVLERPHIIIIHTVRLIVARLALCHLG